METQNRILICARPGHFRESLIAVLKTLPRSELFLLDGLNQGDGESNSHQLQALLLADLDTIGLGKFDCLKSMREKNPNLRCVALVDNHQQARAAYSLGADIVMPRGSSAGELLSTFQHLELARNSMVRIAQPRSFISAAPF